MSSADEIDSFFRETFDLYLANKAKIRKSLCVRGDCDSRVKHFCLDLDGSLKYEYICKFAFVVSNVLGRSLADSIHARMVLGPKNEWVVRYVRYAAELRPHFFWLNMNPNEFSGQTLGPHGSMMRLAFK